MPEAIRPQTNLERELVYIWEPVFQCAPIGIQEDFFDLGDTSVQAARVFAGIEEVFHKRLPISCILGPPAIEQLASVLLPGKSAGRKAKVVPIQKGGEKASLFCVGGGAEWRRVAEHLGPDQPVLSIGLDPGAVGQFMGPNRVERWPSKWCPRSVRSRIGAHIIMEGIAEMADLSMKSRGN
jgi:hypothetical protein